MSSGFAAARRWRPDVAGRTYLQRIAQPLRPGDPVLFAMPQVAPDDARPPAMPPVASAAPASGPVLRRTPSRIASPPPMQAPLPRSAVSPAPAEATTPPPMMSAHGPEIAAASPAPGPVVAGESSLITGAPLPAIQARFGAAPPSVDLPRASPLEVRTTEAVAPIAPTPTVATRESTSASVAAKAIDPPAARAALDVVPTPDRVARPPLRLPGATPPADAGGPPPRIHIGTVEVRAAPPPVPVPVPQAAPRAESRPDAAPISRGYAWRFGLVQG